MNARGESFFESAAHVLYYALWGAEWLCVVGGWLMLFAAGLRFVQPPTQQKPTPYSDSLKLLVGSACLFQIETLLRWIAESVVQDETLMGDRLKTVDLDAWFQMDASYSTGASTTDLALDLAYSAAAVVGYCFFAWGVWRMTQTGRTDSNGRPITAGSGLATLAGGVALVYLPYVLSHIWPELEHPG